MKDINIKVDEALWRNLKIESLKRNIMLRELIDEYLRLAYELKKTKDD
jgi:hypothetical protein